MKKYVLRSTYKTDVPADGFCQYAEKIWEAIITEKDLDLPSQKQMLAIFRCNEIKKSSYALIEPELLILQKSLFEDSILVAEFGKEGKRIVEKSLSDYYLNSKRYDARIVGEKAKELEIEIFSFLKDLFNTQLKLIIQSCTKTLHLQQLQFCEKIRSVTITSETASLMPSLNALAEQTLSACTSLMKASVVSGSNWSYSKEYEELIQNVEDSIVKIKEEYITAYLSSIKENMKKELSNNLLPTLEKADVKTFWSDVREVFLHILEIYSLGFKSILIEYEYAEDVITNKLIAFNKEVFQCLKLLIEEKAHNLDIFMIDKFKKSFLEDSSGTPRSWGEIDDDVFKNIYKKAKLESEKLIDLFSVIRIDSRNEGFAFFEVVDETVSLCPTSRQFDNEIVVIPPMNGQKMLQVFQNGAFTHFQLAQKEKEHSQASQLIPQWIYALLLILGANEIVYVVNLLLFNPAGLILVFILVFSILVVVKFNLWPTLYAMSKPVIENAILLTKIKMGVLNVQPAKSKKTDTEKEEKKKKD